MSIDESSHISQAGTLASAKQNFVDLFRRRQREERNDPSQANQRHSQSTKNPISLLRLLDGRSWACFLVGLLAWTADAFDFHALSIQTKKLALYYGRSKTSITTAITLTLLLRSVGAIGFGLAGDKFGRKWPMVINLIVLGILQVATIYSATFQQFLAVRSLFGLFMGGIFGNAIAMALENCPENARGLMSGILQQGYSMGYVLAASASLGVGGAEESWKTVFWIAAGMSTTIGIIRMLFPESKQFLEARKAGRVARSGSVFWANFRNMLISKWRLVLYCVWLMALFNCYSHISQDSYTTFLLTEKGLSNVPASRASIIMKVGACVGGTLTGHLSQWFGRRRAIIGAALVSGLLIPAWIVPRSESLLSVTGFFMQFFVQGAWGVIPIHLNELSPARFRSTFASVTYQFGNMLASPSAQIVNAIAESHWKTDPDGNRVQAYGPIMGIGTALIVLGITITTALGPERRGINFEDTPTAEASPTVCQEMETRLACKSTHSTANQVDDKDGRA